MITRSEWDRLQYEYFQRLIDENRGQKRLTASPPAEKAAACGGRVSVFGEWGGGNDAGDEAKV
jgi:hypothetical protein